MKKFIITGVAILLAAGGVYAFFQIKYHMLESSLKAYLIHTQGYNESDILSVKAKFSSLPKYPVYVKFTDDSETTYIFTDRDTGEWTQLDPASPQRIKKN